MSTLAMWKNFFILFHFSWITEQLFIFTLVTIQCIIQVCTNPLNTKLGVSYDDILVIIILNLPKI